MRTDPRRLIRTEAGVGYRFVGPVQPAVPSAKWAALGSP
jgi:hypothetical protein